jgi:hypothetical protein
MYNNNLLIIRILRTSTYIMTLIVVLLFITGCEDNGSNAKIKIIGTGPIVTSNLDLSSFTTIKNTGVANINVSLGTPQSVVFKAQQNIMDVMTYKVTDNILEIGIEKNVSIENSDEIIFDITIPAINKIELEGVGEYVLSGDYQDELTIILTGVGNVKAYDLKVGTCNITLTGVGMCEVQVMDQLTATIVGVGNIHYHGDPTIISSVTGLGNLIDANP